ncbi:MAG: MFS transporter [Schwartzia sp. (in: firmicutes)]
MKRVNPFVYLFALGHLATDWAQGAIPALLPYFINHYDLSYRAAASLVFANVMVSSLLQPLSGYYADKMSKSWFIAAGPVCAGLGVTFIGFSSSYWAIFAAAMLCGVGSALFHPEAALMVNRIAGEGKGQAIAIFSMGGNLGFAVGPIAAGICAYTIGIHSLLLFGVVNLAVGAAILWKLPAAQRAASRYVEEEKGGAPETEKRNDWGSFVKLSFAMLARSLSFNLSNTFIPIFWVTVLHSTAQEGTQALSLLFAVGAGLTYVGGVLADRMGYVRVLRLTFCAMIPTMFLLTHATEVWWAAVLLLPAAFAIFVPFSPIVVLGQTYLAKNAGFASGVTLGLSTTLGGILTPLVGWAADLWGLVTALQILWIAGAIGAAASFSLKDDSKKVA